MRRALSVVAIAFTVAGCAALRAEETPATERTLSDADFRRRRPTRQKSWRVFER